MSDTNTGWRSGAGAEQFVRAIADDEPLELTVVLRRRAPLTHTGAAVGRVDLAARYGADPTDLDRVRAFGRTAGLQEVAVDPASRTIRWRGTGTAVQQAFGVRLGRYRADGGAPEFVAPTSEPTLPDPAVVAVLGLDRRPVARPHFRVARAAPPVSYTAVQIGGFYDFPSGNGAGQTIAIIELGGGYRPSDLQTYFGALGLATPVVTAVGVDGGDNSPGAPADTEVLLDIQVAGALVPQASFAVYFAPNTDQGFHDAIVQAAHATPAPAAISISWGGPEDSWAAASRTAMQMALEDAAALGAVVTAAAGDSGSGDGETDGHPHVDFPASSPAVVGCGGTTLDAKAGAIASEVVWNALTVDEGATGGGVSTAFPAPAWQADADVPGATGGAAGRGVPDVAGNADPRTGYRIVVNGQNQVVGGTSAVAPLWAALFTLIASGRGTPLGLVSPALYRLGPDGQPFRDITSGSNGAYRARPGWDACTGWGSPRGQALAAGLGSGS